MSSVGKCRGTEVDHLFCVHSVTRTSPENRAMYAQSGTIETQQ
jgi:hypothetical protein